MVFGFLKRLFTAPTEQDDPQAPLPVVDPAPDTPRPFGYKSCWIAVRADDPLHVAFLLRPVRMLEANWESGLQASEGGGSPVWAFVTPPQDGWVFVHLGLAVTPDHPDRIVRITRWLDTLSATFGQAQYFGSYRVVGFIGWMRSDAGAVTRAFAFADGQCFVNEGAPTEVEVALGWEFTEGCTPEEVENRLFARLEAADDSVDMSEDAPLTVARAWSRSPEVFGSGPSAGLLIRLPD